MTEIKEIKEIKEITVDLREKTKFTQFTDRNNDTCDETTPNLNPKKAASIFNALLKKKLEGGSITTFKTLKHPLLKQIAEHAMLNGYQINVIFDDILIRELPSNVASVKAIYQMLKSKGNHKDAKSWYDRLDKKF